MNASLHCKLQEPTVPITAYCQDLCNGDTARFERRFTVMLSIIIPTYSEEGYIGRTLIALRSCAGIEQCEVLVVDGGSTDGTVREVEGLGIPVVHSLKGRAVQMNAGAANALGDTFYFLHAESVPPPDFVAEISVALAEGAAAGCFPVSYTHLRTHETVLDFVCRLLLEKKKKYILRGVLRSSPHSSTHK